MFHVSSEGNSISGGKGGVWRGFGVHKDPPNGGTTTQRPNINVINTINY